MRESRKPMTSMRIAMDYSPEYLYIYRWQGEKLDSLCEDIKGWDSSVQAPWFPRCNLVFHQGFPFTKPANSTARRQANQGRTMAISMHDNASSCNI